MRVLKWLVYLVLGLVAVLVAGAFALPDRAHVERSIVIARPASMVHAVVDSFALFNRWSPWAELDPATRYTFSGPERGAGASMSWASDDPNVGKGTQTITASTPEAVTIALDFGGMLATSTMRLAAAGEGTELTWAFDADLPIPLDGGFFFGVLGRWFGLGMDGMIGADYVRGLDRLKTLLEGMPSADIASVVATPRELAAQPAYVITGLSAATDDVDSAAVLSAAFAELAAHVQTQGVARSGQPYVAITGHGGGRWQFDAGIPVERADTPAGRVTAGSMAGGRVVDFAHAGPYAEINRTHAAGEAWVATRGLGEGQPRMELFETDPATVPVGQWVAVVRIPVAASPAR
jgi:hypothetical protein